MNNKKLKHIYKSTSYTFRKLPLEFSTRNRIRTRKKWFHRGPPRLSIGVQLTVDRRAADNSEIRIAGDYWRKGHGSAPCRRPRQTCKRIDVQICRSTCNKLSDILLVQDLPHYAPKRKRSAAHQREPTRRVCYLIDASRNSSASISRHPHLK
jgi:hypothetical protein